MAMTKEKMSTLIKMAAVAYQVLEEGQSVQLNFPLSNVVDAKGQAPIGSIIFMRPKASIILQSRQMPEPISNNGEHP